MFLTGEFSRIARISKRTLQYYDKIGLLTPALTDPQTGYRYYSARQLPRLNRILALKELGLTLQQIARMLAEDVSNEEIHGMLRMQKADLEQKLRNDLDRFRRIETRLQHKQPDALDVVVKSVPEREILSASHFCLNADDGFRFIAYLQQHLPAKVDEHALGHFIALADSDEFAPENIDLEFGFFVEGKVPSRLVLGDDVVMTTRMLPPIETMATAVFVGHPQSSSAAYNSLGAWIENNGYRLSGLQREIFIELPRPQQEPEVVLEIQFPVEKIGRPYTFLNP